MISAAIIGLGMLQLAGTNDITVKNNDWLVLGKKDPYIWINAPQVDGDAKGVLIDYQIADAPKKYGTEVYYATNLHSFSEKFKHYFNITTQAKNLIYVPVDLINDEFLKVFRLDFDQCAGCRIKFNQITLVGEDDLANVSSYQPVDYQSKIEQKKIIIDPDGKQLALSDPYILKILPEGKENAKGLLIKYAIKDAPSSYQALLYYSTDLHLFSEELKYKFNLQRQSENTLFIPFDLIDGEKLRALMLDFKECPGCQIQLSSVELIDKDKIDEYAQFKPADFQSHFDTKKENISSKGMRIALEDFRLKDLALVAKKKLKVVGHEPRLDSPPLELSIEKFAGIYLRFKVPDAQKTGMYINLDWNTARYGHRKKMVTRWSDINNNLAEMFIPFDPISAEQWLKYFWIRLEPQMGDEYIVEEVLIIPQQNRQEFADLTPSLANFPGAISSKLGIIKGGIKRMLEDWGFLLIYTLILISVGSLVLRNLLVNPNKSRSKRRVNF